eukprot:g12626.t1
MASSVTDDVTAEVKRVVRNMGSTAADIVDFTHELGGEVPVVDAVLRTLTAIREKVETVQSKTEGMKELERRCTYVTARVVVKRRQNSSSEMDVTPLESCVKAAEEFIERCSRRGWCGRCTKVSSDKDELAKLNPRSSNGATGWQTTWSLSADGVLGSDDEEDWAEAVSAIDAEMRVIAGKAEAQKSDEGLAAAKRAAILRVGLLDFAAQNAFNPLLYLSLAVMPNGRAFGAEEADVLLYDDGADDGASRRRTRQAAKVLPKLEQSCG